jgi:hypothetical protein
MNVTATQERKKTMTPRYYQTAANAAAIEKIRGLA